MAKPITLRLSHDLGIAGARARIEGGLSKLTEMMGDKAKVESHWEGDNLLLTGAAMGQTIGARLEVLADEVRLQLTLPPLLGMMAGKLTSRIEKEGQILLEKK